MVTCPFRVAHHPSPRFPLMKSIYTATAAVVKTIFATEAHSNLSFHTVHSKWEKEARVHNKRRSDRLVLRSCLNTGHPKMPG